MLVTVSSQGHKPENITRPPTHANTSFLLIAFPALEITDHPGTANCIHPKIPKTTQDTCNPWIFSAWDFWGGGRTFDLGMFLVSRVYSLAAYATALTHFYSPPARMHPAPAAAPVRHMERLQEPSRLLLPEDCMARKEKHIKEAAKLAWKWCAHTKDEEDPEAALEGPSPGKDKSWEDFLEGEH